MVWPIFWILGGAAAVLGAGAYLESEEKKKKLPPGDGPKDQLGHDKYADVVDAEFIDLGPPGTDPFAEAVKKQWDEEGQTSDRREQERAILLLKEAYGRQKTGADRLTRLSLEAAEKELQSKGGRITKLEVNPLASGNPGRHITIEYDGDPLPKLHVVRVVGQPLTSDIGTLQANSKHRTVLADRLEKSPVGIFDPDEVIGKQIVYYAWLEQEVTYTTHSVTIPDLEIVSEEVTATAVWGVVSKELLLEKPKLPAPTPKAKIEPPKPPTPPRAIPHVDDLTTEILLAAAPIVEAKKRKEKLEEIVAKFVELHGLEDEAGEVAQAAYDALDVFNEKANKKG